jgi:hypothetical protein
MHRSHTNVASPLREAHPSFIGNKLHGLLNTSFDVTSDLAERFPVQSQFCEIRPLIECDLRSLAWHICAGTNPPAKEILLMCVKNTTHWPGGDEGKKLAAFRRTRDNPMLVLSDSVHQRGRTLPHPIQYGLGHAPCRDRVVAMSSNSKSTVNVL